MSDEELIESLRLWNRDDAADRIEQLAVTNEQLTIELNEVRKEWEGWQSAAFKLMEKVTALTAERDKYEGAWMTAEGRLEDAMEGLEKCQAELDEYSRQEYPLDHTVHERYRQRDYDANPARITLAALKGQSHD